MNKKVWAILGVGVVTLISVYRTEKVVEEIEKTEKKEKEIVFHDLKAKESKLGFTKNEVKREVASEEDIAKKRAKLIETRKQLWEIHHKQKEKLKALITKYKVPIYNKRFIVEDDLYLVRTDTLDSLGNYELYKKMGPYSIVETDNPPEVSKTTIIRDIKTLNLGYYTGEIKVELKNTNDIYDIIDKYNNVKIVNVFNHINTAIISVSGLASATEFIEILKKDSRVKNASVDIVMSNRRAN